MVIGDADFAAIQRIAKRALHLASEAEAAKAAGCLHREAEIFGELQEKLLPEVIRYVEVYTSNPELARLALGLVLRVLQRYSEAVVHFSRVLEVLPANIIALQEMLVCLRQLGRHDEALRYARRAVQVEPDSAAVIGDLAACLGALGKWTEARRVLADASLLGSYHEERSS